MMWQRWVEDLCRSETYPIFSKHAYRRQCEARGRALVAMARERAKAIEERDKYRRLVASIAEQCAGVDREKLKALRDERNDPMVW